MIFIHLKGGLGNQMFQYACAKALAIHNKTSVGLDISFYQEQKRLDDFTPRTFELLDAFDLPDCRVVDKAEFQYITKTEKTLKESLKYKLNKATFYFEKSLAFDNTVFETVKRHAFLEGSFQSFRYFGPYSKQIIDAFKFRENNLNKKSNHCKREIERSTAVGIHLRRGDYVNNKAINQIHGPCDLDYYYRGLKALNLDSNTKLFIFSDDPQWVKYNFESEFESIFVDWNKKEEAWQDMYLMSLCDHFIIANSTFSWWAAYLSRSENKAVIAPDNWFRDPKRQKRSADLIPDSWMRI